MSENREENAVEHVERREVRRPLGKGPRMPTTNHHGEAYQGISYDERVRMLWNEFVGALPENDRGQIVQNPTTMRDLYNYFHLTIRDDIEAKNRYNALGENSSEQNREEFRGFYQEFVRGLSQDRMNEIVTDIQRHNNVNQRANMAREEHRDDAARNVNTGAIAAVLRNVVTHRGLDQQDKAQINTAMNSINQSSQNPLEQLDTLQNHFQEQNPKKNNIYQKFINLIQKMRSYVIDPVVAKLYEVKRYVLELMRGQGKNMNI